LFTYRNWRRNWRRNRVEEIVEAGEEENVAVEVVDAANLWYVCIHVYIS
jgi:hypothetical protein